MSTGAQPRGDVPGRSPNRNGDTRTQRFHSIRGLAFQDIKSDFLIGAYADIAERVMTKASYLGCGPYRTPNARIHARAVLSHTTPSCASAASAHRKSLGQWSCRWTQPHANSASTG